MTLAHTVSAELDHDGLTWRNERDESLDEIATRVDPEHTTDSLDGVARLRFSDGSAIVAGPGGWDIEGKAPWSWAGIE